MAYCTVSGLPVMDARITLPRVGAWTADLRLTGDAQPSGRVTIVFGGLSFSGTVQRAGAWAGSGMVRVVGGAASMSKLVPAKAYRGTTVRLPVVDALGAVGEDLDDVSDAGVLATGLTAWVMRAEAAGGALARILDQVAGAIWRVRPSGKVWVGVDSYPGVKLAAQVLEQDALNRRVTTSVVPGLLPGVTWNGGRVSFVEHQLGQNQLRSRVGFEL